MKLRAPRRGPFTRAAELRALLDEVAVVDWRDPAWWALIGIASAAETWAQLRGGAPPSYLSSDAEPSGDTFMGWASPAPRRLADAIADAIADAVAAWRALTELDGTLPAQALRVAVRAGDAAATLVPADPSVVRFSVAGRRHTFRMSGRPDELLGIAGSLATLALALTPTLSPHLSEPAAIAAVIGDHDPAVARHLHRRTWDAHGGPWLGLGRAGGLAVASTCHLVVDGFGHAAIAAAIAGARDHDAALRARLATAAAAVVGDAPVPAPPPLAGVVPLGVTWRRIAGPLPRFAHLAHALGVILHGEAGDPGAAHSPTMQIPVAPGAPDDPARFRRRVVTALLSVRFADGRPEPLETFAARVAEAIAREAAGAGLLSRLVAAAAALPLPLAVKRRRLVGASSRHLAGPIEVLAGRSSLSLLRVAEAAPLIAISAPRLVLPPDAAISTSVITAVVDPSGATLAVAGTGRAGDPAGAADLLDRWIERWQT